MKLRKKNFEQNFVVCPLRFGVFELVGIHTKLVLNFDVAPQRVYS